MGSIVNCPNCNKSVGDSLGRYALFICRSCDKLYCAGCGDNGDECPGCGSANSRMALELCRY